MTAAAWVADLVVAYPVLVVVPLIAGVAAFLTYRVAQSVVEWCSRIVRSAIYGIVALLVFVVVAAGLALGVYVAAPQMLAVAPPVPSSPTALVVGAVVDRYWWWPAAPALTAPAGKRWVLVDDLDEVDEVEAPPPPPPPAPAPADTVAGRKMRRQQQGV